MTKIAGSGSGSRSQRQGSAAPDPDPHQNVMDPEHCFQLTIFTPMESLRKDFGLKLSLCSILLLNNLPFLYNSEDLFSRYKIKLNASYLRNSKKFRENFKEANCCKAKTFFPLFELVP
jgi:hypothetical protein